MNQKRIDFGLLQAVGSCGFSDINAFCKRVGQFKYFIGDKPVIDNGIRALP
jgi:hypothetical protein